ncbi:MAG: phosphopantetheine-binding protein [Methylomonas sp.]
MENLEAELKRLIIDVFELEDISPDDIASDSPLFGEGLGLDSIDALELGLALKKRYNIYIDTHSTELVEHFASVKSLARFVVSQQEARNV